MLVQDVDNHNFNLNQLKQVSDIALDSRDLQQLLFAVKVCKHLKSNAIAVVANFQTVGLGIGQTNRVDSCEIACKKAVDIIQGDIYKQYYQDKNTKLFLASDAFLPFADNVEIAHKFGNDSENYQQNIKVFISEIGWREFAYYLLYHFVKYQEIHSQEQEF